MTSLLDLDIRTGPGLWIADILAIAALAGLVVRRPARRWMRVAGLGALAGLIIGLAVVFVVQDLLDVFNSPISVLSRTWIYAASAACGLAVASLWTTRGWRRAVAVFAVPWFLVTAALGVNAGFGLEPTIGDLIGVETQPALLVPPLVQRTSSEPDSTIPLADRWTPPATLPASRTGRIVIPSTASDFSARDAVVWLPPAALVDDPPDLPVVVMMMGQPGSPSVDIIGDVLDEFAARHSGLAPIVVSVDQLGGSDTNNPLCIDGYQGDARTYVSIDVPAFIRSTFNVQDAREAWTVAGFSNGGICALTLGALFPETFGNIIDVSGELQPDLGSVGETIDTGFDGDSAAYNRAKPTSILATHRYTDTWAIFASGSFDEPYLGASRTLVKAASAAGMTTSLEISSGTSHGGATLEYGLNHAFETLYPRLGLST